MLRCLVALALVGVVCEATVPSMRCETLASQSHIYAAKQREFERRTWPHFDTYVAMCGEERESPGARFIVYHPLEFDQPHVQGPGFANRFLGFAATFVAALLTDRILLSSDLAYFREQILVAPLRLDVPRHIRTFAGAPELHTAVPATLDQLHMPNAMLVSRNYDFYAPLLREDAYFALRWRECFGEMSDWEVFGVVVRYLFRPSVQAQVSLERGLNLTQYPTVAIQMRTGERWSHVPHHAWLDCLAERRTAGRVVAIVSDCNATVLFNITHYVSTVLASTPLSLRPLALTRGDARHHVRVVKDLLLMAHARRVVATWGSTFGMLGAALSCTAPWWVGALHEAAEMLLPRGMTNCRQETNGVVYVDWRARDDAR